MRIQSINSNLILAFEALQAKRREGKDEIDLKEMFYNLSLKLGGDGETIKKKDLDKYIEKAEKGEVKDVSKRQLNALKMIQTLWDTISTDGDKEFITAGDMKDYVFLLVMATTEDFEVPENTDKSILESMLEEVDPKDISSKLSELLDELLAGTTDENDDMNANLIDMVTNLIAAESSQISIEAEA